jgi:hypothetical protein
MKISVHELLEVIRILRDHLQATQPPEINVEEDYYWHIPESERYDPYKKPSELTLGQLSDDWSELRKLLDQDRVPAGLDFVWLASILRKLGEKQWE